MHEHVRDDLIWLEIFRGDEVQTKKIGEINIRFSLKNKCDHEHESVDDHDIFYDRRKNVKSGWTILLHGREDR